MKKLFVGILLVAGLSAPARAALVCATPQEMKLLQSAALQQQLALAAMSCRMTADYSAFVAAYRDRLVLADQALKAFFAARPRGENYAGYKTRLAANVSLRSQRDPRFCESAQKVFDIALGRGGERRGLAPEPPQLIDTGYEGCRPVADKVMEASVAPRPQSRPQTKLAAVPVPLLRPAIAAPAQIKIARAAPQPVMPHSSAHALALAPGAPAPRPVTAPVRITMAAPKPVQVAHVEPKTVTPPAQSMPLAKPLTLAKADPAPLPPAKLVTLAPPKPVVQLEHKVIVADDLVRPLQDSEPAWSGPDEPAPRYAAIERPQWRHAQAYTQYDPQADDHIPNAYRAGAEWVRDAGPSWAPASYPPPRRSPPHYLVQTPDGHWVVVIGHQRQWVER